MRRNEGRRVGGGGGGGQGRAVEGVDDEDALERQFAEADRVRGTHVHTCTHLYTHVHTYTCTHIHMYTHTHTQTRRASNTVYEPFTV